MEKYERRHKKARGYSLTKQWEGAESIRHTILPFKLVKMLLICAGNSKSYDPNARQANMTSSLAHTNAITGFTGFSISPYIKSF